MGFFELIKYCKVGVFEVVDFLWDLYGFKGGFCWNVGEIGEVGLEILF